MHRFYLIALFILLSLFLNAQSGAELKASKDTLVGENMELPHPSHELLPHNHVDSIEYFPDVEITLESVQKSLHRIKKNGLQYAIQYLEQDSNKPSELIDSLYLQDSLQHAVRILLNYAKNDSIRLMVNYLKDYFKTREVDAAMQIVKKRMCPDTMLNHLPDSVLMEEEEENSVNSWKNEAVKALYNYIKTDSVNQWLQEINRDSVHVTMMNAMNDSLNIWINNGKNNFKRFWLKKSQHDSIGIWIQNTANKSIRLLVDTDVYQESMLKNKRKGIKTRLQKRIPEEEYKLAKITQKQHQYELWKKGSVLGLGLNQGHVSNWAEGGESSIAALTTVNMFANYKKGSTQWDNTLEIRYGLLKTGENGFRKNEDRFEFNTKYGQKAIENWFYSFMLNIKTQFFKGYDYSGEERLLVSNFLSPGYFLFSLGMDYKLNNDLSILLSPITGKWTYVKDAGIDQTKYGIDIGKHTKKETGAYVKILHKWEITEDIVLDNEFALYSGYSNKPKNIDVDWQMNLLLQVNSHMNTRVSTHLISDDDTGSKVQFKENLTVGISYRF